jgi:DNA-binding transcriptional regulator YdaS (Cro superfamily)
MIEIVAKGAEKAGGLGKLADALGITHQSFYSWKKVPAERVIDFETATGIPRGEVRPDLYPSQGDDAGPDARTVSAADPSGPAAMEAAE